VCKVCAEREARCALGSPKCEKSPKGEAKLRARELMTSLCVFRLFCFETVLRYHSEVRRTDACDSVPDRPDLSPLSTNNWLDIAVQPA
jgi:hypothetical protein